MPTNDEMADVVQIFKENAKKNNNSSTSDKEGRRIHVEGSVIGNGNIFCNGNMIINTRIIFLSPRE